MAGAALTGKVVRNWIAVQHSFCDVIMKMTLHYNQKRC